MSKNDVTKAVLTAGGAAIVAGALVFAYVSWRAPAGPGFEAAVREYLIANPGILVEMQNALAARQDAENLRVREDALADAGLETLTDPNIAYVTGPEDAAVTVAEFFDYRCPYCKASLPEIEAAIANRPEIRFAFIEYPILSQESLVAATAAVAARRQPDKYVPFHIALMEDTVALSRVRILEIAQSVGLDIAKLEADMEDPEVEASLDASHELAERLHVNGTPTFIINGKFVVGALSEGELDMLLDDIDS